jgi:hypothetical protein
MAKELPTDRWFFAIRSAPGISFNRKQSQSGGFHHGIAAGESVIPSDGQCSRIAGIVRFVADNQPSGDNRLFFDSRLYSFAPSLTGRMNATVSFRLPDNLISNKPDCCPPYHCRFTTVKIFVEAARDARRRGGASRIRARHAVPLQFHVTVACLELVRNNSGFREGRRRTAYHEP